MPLLVLTWNLPPAASLIAYAFKARTQWIPSVLAQPGVEEIRAFRNGAQMKPDVMTTVEFESIQALESYMGSRQYSTVIAGLRSVGCNDLTAMVWNPSPLLPARMRPAQRAGV